MGDDSGIDALGLQCLLGLVYYFSVLVLVRLAGKRLAGQMTAGLRKLGFESPAEVKLAMLEETGHVSAIAADEHPRSAR